MKFLKNNKKIIAAFAAGLIIAGGAATYGTYTYLASNITYTKEGTSVSTVSEALNDLYSKTTELSTMKSDVSQTTATANDILLGKKAYTKNGLIIGAKDMTPTFGTLTASAYNGSRTNNNSTSLNLNKGKYLVVVSDGMGWRHGQTEVPESERFRYRNESDVTQLNLTCTKTFNKQFLSGYSTSALASEVQDGMRCKNRVINMYYILDILSDNSTVTATMTQTESLTTSYIVLLSAIPIS